MFSPACMPAGGGEGGGGSGRRNRSARYVAAAGVDRMRGANMHAWMHTWMHTVYALSRTPSYIGCGGGGVVSS